MQSRNFCNSCLQTPSGLPAVITPRGSADQVYQVMQFQKCKASNSDNTGALTPHGLQVNPSWWGHQEPQPHSRQPKYPEQQPQPPPRLAYSIQLAANPELPLHSNDLITAAYLDIPSSGYGAAQKESAAKRALTWKGPAHQASGPPAQATTGKENIAGA